MSIYFHDSSHPFSLPSLYDCVLSLTSRKSLNQDCLRCGILSSNTINAAIGPLASSSAFISWPSLSFINFFFLYYEL